MSVEPVGRPAEVLLVEDNYGDVLLTQEAFRRARLNYRLSVAGDGEEAMRILRREGPYDGTIRPDMILLDLNLPRMDGAEVLAAVKADPNLRVIPVVVLTSSRAEIDVLKSYQLSCNGYIVKPVDLLQLGEVVASIEAFWFKVATLAHAAETAHA